MRQNNLVAQIGYKRKYVKGSKLSNVADDVLDRNFAHDAPNIAWVINALLMAVY